MLLIGLVKDELGRHVEAVQAAVEAAGVAMVFGNAGDSGRHQERSERADPSGLGSIRIVDEVSLAADCLLPMRFQKGFCEIKEMSGEGSPPQELHLLGAQAYLLVHLRDLPGAAIRRLVNGGFVRQPAIARLRLGAFEEIFRELFNGFQVSLLIAAAVLMDRVRARQLP